jgi:hypothetical protein
MRYYLMVAYNWAQGYRMYWVETPGSPAGGYWDYTEKMCPYPIRFDWSVKACVRAGDCGCNKGLRAAIDRNNVSRT